MHHGWNYWLKKQRNKKQKQNKNKNKNKKQKKKIKKQNKNNKLDPVPFSRARGKLGVDILKFQIWCFIDFWPLFVCRQSYRWHFCMFVQRQHIDTVNFVNWHYFQFDLSLTFDSLSLGRTKRSPWTLLHLRPRLTHWPFYFCHLTHFVIWPFFDLWPLSVGRTKRWLWTRLHLRPRLTHWHLYFGHLTHFVIWPFFDLCPLTVGPTKRSP